MSIRVTSVGGGSGVPGPQGPPGNNGASAYDIATENGFEGTEQEWLDSIGGSADLGGFLIDGTTLSTIDDEENISINAKDEDGRVTSRLYLNPDEGISRLEGVGYTDQYFEYYNWSEAVLTTFMYGSPAIRISGFETIGEFLNSSEWNRGSDRSISIDNGPHYSTSGYEYDETYLYIYLEESARPETDPTTINSIRFKWANVSRIQVDQKDDQEISIRGIDIDVYIDSTDDITLNAEDDLRLYADDEIQLSAQDSVSIQAENKIVLTTYNGGQFLNTENNPLNQIATIGDIGIETSYEVQGGTLGAQPTFSGTPLFSASYVKMSSNLVHFQIQVDMDNITSFGNGQYYMTLPFKSRYGYKFRDGCLHDASTGRTYHISAHVYPESNQINLYATNVSGQSLYDFEFTSTSPITLDVADSFHIAGTYLTYDEVEPV